MSVGHLDHVLWTVSVYSSMKHVTWKSCGWVCRILHPDSCNLGSSWSKGLLSIWFVTASLPTTYALSQSWFTSTAWSVMDDLWVTLLSLAPEARVCVPAVKESTSFLCSLILTPNFLPVFLMYELELSCKVHNRSIRFSPHPWSCPSDELQSSVAFGEDG